MKKTYQNSTYIFLHRLRKGIADALIKLFVPLLIYKATGDLKLCFLYCTISYVLAGVLFIVLKRFITKYPILSIILHILPLIAMIYLLNCEFTLPIIIIVAIVDALATTLYYGGLNLIFGFSDDRADTAKFESADHIGKIIFILLGAIILGEVQNSLIFVAIFASVMYIFSIIPLLLNYRRLTEFTKNIKVLNAQPIIKDNKYFNLYHICYSVLHTFTTIFLPLYLYASGLSFTVAGVVLVLQELMFVLGAYVAKLFAKLGKEKIFIFWGAFLIALCSALVWIISNVVLIYILTLIISFAFQGIFVIVFQKFIVDQKQKGFYQNSMFYRDVVLNFSRASTSGIYLATLCNPLMFILGIIFSGGVVYTSTKCLNENQN